MRISDQIVRLAEIWAECDGRSLARLSTIVLNRGSFFERMAGPGAGCTVETIERFLVFFRDGANWPDGRIPLAAIGLLDNFSNIATEASAGQVVDTIGGEVQSPGTNVADSPCSDLGQEQAA